MLLPTVLDRGVGITGDASTELGDSDSATGLVGHDGGPASVAALAAWTVGDGVRRAEGVKTDFKRIVMLSAIPRFNEMDGVAWGMV